ncbi:MAG: hypothetical protein ABIV42_03855 [Nitrosospira sp.]
MAGAMLLTNIIIKIAPDPGLKPHIHHAGLKSAFSQDGNSRARFL